MPNSTVPKAIPKFHRLTQSYYKSVTDSSFALALAFVTILACVVQVGLWAGEKRRFVDRMIQSTPDKHHASYGSAKVCFPFAPGGETCLTSIDWQWHLGLFADTTSKVLVMTTWFASLSYGFTD